ncbi:MAG: GNAT family N-acetyltransferase [Minisyncoccota bacterium]
MEFRKATDADLRSIRDIIAQFPDTLMQEHLPRAEEFYLAEDSGKVVGCCALEVYSQRLAEVRSLAVLPDYRGQGIATTLVEKCLAEADALGVYEVLTITGATSLFEKQGFGAFNKEKFALFKILAD